jgi:hypothetical protein
LPAESIDVDAGWRELGLERVDSRACEVVVIGHHITD